MITPAIDFETTVDGLLNRRVALEQPRHGYRVAVDTVLLAAAVPARSGDAMLDLGCGVGGAMLCVAARVPGLTGLGIDIQAGLVALCRRNIARNAFASGLDAALGEIGGLPDALEGRFDHVLMNPPYHDAARHDASPNAIKKTANLAIGDLAVWIDAAARALRPGGSMTIIHRADCQEEILSCLRPAFGEVTILALLPRSEQEPKRILLCGRKGKADLLQICEPLILHQKNGGYTAAVEAILRDAQSIIFQGP